MLMKVIFLSSPNKGDCVKRINLHFFSSILLLLEAKIPEQTTYFQVFYIFYPPEVYKWASNVCKNYIFEFP